jgi:hypothetical protein
MTSTAYEVGSAQTRVTKLNNTDIFTRITALLDSKLPVQFLISAMYTRCYNLILPAACYVGITGTETERLSY